MHPQHLLIDVRSPAEFATGALKSDIATPTLNIEYTSIASLPSVYAARGIDVQKSADITLYCRSGRRSAIAKTELESLGYANVRDIGGLEEARRTLDREEVGRQIEEEVGDVGKEGYGGVSGGDGGKGKKEERERGFGKLVEGLKGLEAEGQEELEAEELEYRKRQAVVSWW